MFSVVVSCCVVISYVEVDSGVLVRFSRPQLFEHVVVHEFIGGFLENILRTRKTAADYSIDCASFQIGFLPCWFGFISGLLSCFCENVIVC